MRRKLGEPLSIPDIARSSGVSLRGLQLLYQRRLGTTPLLHLRSLRLAAARKVLDQAPSGETVSAVARRHGLVPSQLFIWRRQLGEQMVEHGLVVPEATKPEPTFVPAVIDSMPDPDPAPQNKPVRRRRRSKAGAVELEVDGITVKIARGADAGTISAVITALRETR